MESISTANNGNKISNLMFNYKNILTFAVFFAYFANAINYSLIGPTLTSLTQLFNVSIEEISLIYTIRSFSYTIGALSGFAFKYLNRQLCLIMFTLFMGITLGAMPVLGPIVLFFIVGGINGLMAGGSDTAVNAWIIELWSRNSGPIMNALHFAFGTGSIVAPLIAQPFLKDNEKKWHLTIAYSIAGSICIASAILMTIFYFHRKYKPDEHLEPIEIQRTQSLPEEIIQESGRYELSPKFGLFIFILGCLLLATYVATEMTFFSFQSTFVQHSALNISESDAASLASATAAAFTITRGIGIIIALKLSSFAILLCHFFIIIAFNLMIIFTYDLSLTYTWISNLGVGIGCSSVYPTIYAFLQQSFEIDNRKASISLFVGGLVSAIYPFIVGKSMTEKPLVLVYLNIVSIGLCIALLVAIKFIIYKFSRISYTIPRT